MLIRLILVFLIAMTATHFVGFARAHARGESCSSRDFRPALGPVRDQSHSGYCWAYSASDLISQKVGRLVSATDLATTFLTSPADRLRTSAFADVRNYVRKRPQFFTALREARDHEESWIGRRKAKRAMKMIDNEDHGFTSLGGDESQAILLANLKGVCAEAKFPSDPDAVITMMKTAKHNVRLKKNLSAPCLKEINNDSTIGSLGAIGGAIVKAYETAVDERCERRPLKSALLPQTIDYREVLSESSRHRSRELRQKLVSKTKDALDLGRAVSVIWT